MDNSRPTPAEGALGAAAPLTWRAAGRSVMGASHTRSGKPNQDALGWSPDSGLGSHVILAVADGHGSAKCFRSERGSRMAVATALAEIARLLEEQGTGDLSAVKRLGQERLPQALVRQWKQSVEEDLAREPLTDTELLTLGRSEGEASQDLVAGQPILAYGSTLLAVAATPQYLLYVQIGDGDILSVSDSGEVTRPVSSDHRLFANETTSLCSTDAWKDFRVTFQVLSAAPPALILLSSDGYANSFQDESSFLQVGSDIHEMVQTQGLDVVAGHLEQWLTESTHEGSGDDITLGILMRSGFGSARTMSYRPEATVRMPVETDAATVVMPPHPAVPRSALSSAPILEATLPNTLTSPATSWPDAEADAPTAPPAFASPPASGPVRKVVRRKKQGRRRLMLLIAACILLFVAAAGAIGWHLLHILLPQTPPGASGRPRPHGAPKSPGHPTPQGLPTPGLPSTPPIAIPAPPSLGLPPGAPHKPHRRRHPKTPEIAIPDQTPA